MWFGSDRYQPCYLIIFCLLLIFWVGHGDEWKIYNYLKGVFSYGHVLYPTMFIIVKFLLNTVICHYKYVCETLHQSGHIHRTPCFMTTPTVFLCDTTYKFPWIGTFNTPSLTGIPTYIFLVTKMDSLLTNQGEIGAQVTDTLETWLDERNIGGEYNTMRMMGF